MRKKKYTHIFFDLDNTLWDFEKNSRLAMYKTFNHFELDSVLADFNQFFTVYSNHNSELWEKYRKKEIGKKELIKKRFQKTFEDLGISTIVPEAMNAFYLEEMPKQKALNSGVIETLETLKLKGYKLFIITNGFKEVQFKKIERTGLAKYFDKIYISEVIKTPKPGRQIFEYAIKSSNAKKVNSLMIGDNWEIDVLGAVNFGIDAVYYENSRDIGSEDYPPKLDGANTIYRIRNVQQLIMLL